MLKKTALIFSGQGAQHPGMGKDLAVQRPEARDLFDRADALLQNDFSKICFEGPDARLTDTSYCQPALFVHGLALLAVLRAEIPDFQFQMAAGLSLGEFTAHAAAGHFSFEEGLKLVAARGRLMQESCETTEGGMLTLLGGDRAKAEQLARETSLEVANVNCPEQTVLSGPKTCIPAAIQKAPGAGFKRAVPLNVAGAYHSRLMSKAQEGLLPILKQTCISDSHVAVYANVTGQRVQGADAIRDTLHRQVSGTVLWQACVEAMVADGAEHFIELGPGKILAGLCKRIPGSAPCISVGTLGELIDRLNEIEGK